MRNTRNVVLALLLTVASALTLTPTAADAARASSVKFWASEFKVSQEMPKDVPEGEIAIPKITLEIRGRASAYGGDKVDFEFSVPDARMWLDLLQICSGSSARLSGTIAGDSRIQEDDRKIVGEGKLEELNCRQILK